MHRDEHHYTSPNCGYFVGQHKARNESMAQAYRSGHYILVQVGEHVGVSYATVSRAVKQMKADRKMSNARPDPISPPVLILTWCLLVVTMQLLSRGVVLVSAGMVLFCAFLVSRRKLVQLLRRTRWIMLSLLLVYAYSIPGQSVSDGLGVFSPSYEGLADGMLQLSRLLAALAGLALLLDYLHRPQLIAGLYDLFVPLQWIGLSRERFAVRLALTLHYAEVAMLRDTGGWQGALRDLHEPREAAEEVGNDPADRTVELPLSRFAVADLLLLGFAVLMLCLALR